MKNDIQNLAMEAYPVLMQSIGDEKEWDMNEQWRECWIEGYTQALTIPVVSNQRELLLDFLKEQEYCGLVEISEGNFDHYVDEYLKDK